MTWKKVKGQNNIKTLLQKAIMSNHVAHAYCFTGSSGIGKEAMALMFAKVMNCDSPIIKNNTIDSCNVCPGCKLADKLQHPNIHLIFPILSAKSDTENIAESLSDNQLNEIREQLNLKSENLYYKIQISKANQILISQIREIKKELNLSSNYNKRKFIIIFNAEDMTISAANAFLKTLEEPKENVTIILCTSKPEKILPTIISRCQQINFPLLNEQDLSELLVEKHNLSESDAKLFAQLGQGSYTQAIEFLDEKILQLRNEIINILRISLKKAYRIELIDKLSSIFQINDKKIIEFLLKYLIVWLRDALVITKINSNELVINRDQLEILNRFSQKFGQKPIAKVIEYVEAAINYNAINVNQQLLLLNLFIKIRKELLT